jgi:hypothetical protein
MRSREWTGAVSHPARGVAGVRGAQPARHGDVGGERPTQRRSWQTGRHAPSSRRACRGPCGLVHGDAHRHPRHPGDQRLLATGTGAGESTASGAHGSHAHAPHHPDCNGQNSNALEHQRQQWPCTGTSTMSQLGGAPERSLELRPARPCPAPRGGGRREREVPWGTRPAGRRARAHSAMASAVVPKCLT